MLGGWVGTLVVASFVLMMICFGFLVFNHPLGSFRQACAMEQFNFLTQPSRVSNLLYMQSLSLTFIGVAIGSDFLTRDADIGPERARSCATTRAKWRCAAAAAAAATTTAATTTATTTTAAATTTATTWEYSEQ